MSRYEDHFEKILDLIEKYQNLINCHLADFITEDSWNKFVPSSMKLDLEETASKNMDINWWKTELSIELENFKNITQSLKLDGFPEVMHFEEWSMLLAEHNIHKLKDNHFSKDESKFMKDKKWHEVDIFTKTIAHLIKTSSNLIIDVGAGKAYLSEHVSKTYDIPVLAIESSTSNHNSALRRKELMKRKKFPSSSKVHYVIENIDDVTNYSDLVNIHFPNEDADKNIILIGLHTCGNLTHSISKSFINSKDIECLCVVPCCYHLMTDSLTRRLILSKNARMLAQQSIERTYCRTEPLCRTLFYRTILQVLLKSMGLNKAKVGRGAPVSDFPNYAQWALMKINVPTEKMPSKDSLESLYKIHAVDQWKYEVFQLLRIYLAPVLEAAIILDIAIYLQKKDDCSEARIVQLFDSTVSPRNHAIIATK